MSEDEFPERGSRWTHPLLRGVWTVQSAGSKNITLKSSIPQLTPTVIPTGQWPGTWERA
jgi:hypothetical protein